MHEWIAIAEGIQIDLMHVFIDLIFEITLLSRLFDFVKVKINHDLIYILGDIERLVHFASETILLEHGFTGFWVLCDRAILVINDEKDQLTSIVFHSILERGHLVEGFHNCKEGVLIIDGVMKLDI